MAKDERQFTVSLEGMLKIEEPKRTRTFTTQKPQKPWATLDDVPEFALATMSQMYNVLIKPFEKAYGVVIYGPVTHQCSPECGHWGRRVQLPTGELMQLKFSPRTMLEEAHDGIALISIRVTNTFGQANVRTAILFPPELDVPANCDPIRRSCNILGPRGLHLMMMSFFRQHDAKAGSNRLSSASWTTDPFGYGSVRSTTFSVTNINPTKVGKKAKRGSEDTRKSEFHNFDHGCATLVAPGTSGMLIAAEIVNCDMPDSPRRAAEPVHTKDWNKLMETATEGICREDDVVGRSAIAASVALTELLSGEGIIGMMSNEFFHGALPDKLHNPLGVGLMMAMSVRIAMVPGLHGLKAGNVADQIASAEVRALFEAQTEAIPFLDKMWAIDVTISMAKKNTKSARNFGDRVDISGLVYDQINYWHRVGQSIITSIYGPGTSLDRPPPGSKFGSSPWRFEDPLIAARDAKSIDLGVNGHNVRDMPRINLAPIATRRSQLMRMLLEMEKYLRTGKFVDQQLQPKNDDAPADAQMMANQVTLNELIMPQIKHQLNQGLDKMDMLSHREMQNKLYGCYNMSAVAQATMDMTEALTAGPVVHFKHRIGAYLVSESQYNLCCDCGQPVHVLQGIMLMYAYGECMTCHSKRCLDCSSKYGLDMLMSGSRTWGKQCMSCGANPPRAHAEKVTDANGKESYKLHIEDPKHPSPAGAPPPGHSKHAHGLQISKKKAEKVADALARGLGEAMQVAGLESPASP